MSKGKISVFVDKILISIAVITHCHLIRFISFSNNWEIVTSGMNYRILGKSDLKVSEIGFGCMSLGNDHRQNEQLIAQAIDHGINFFDTADLYQFGFNEETVGRALKSRRPEIVLATKVGNQWNSDKTAWSWNASKEYILHEVEQSLKRLSTDYIDLYQLHGGTINDPIDDTIEAFELLKSQGKIRYYGISSIRPNVIREYLNRSQIDSIMMQYSLLDRRPEQDCLPMLNKNGISLLARGTMAGGILANQKLHSLKKHDRSYPGFSRPEIDKLLEEMDATPYSRTSIALHFVLDNPVTASAVTGIRTSEQLNDIVQAWQEKIPGDLLESISKTIRIENYKEHL